MLVKEYFNMHYALSPADIEPWGNVHRGAQKRFSDDIGVPYQAVQRWVKYGYTVSDGCVVKQLKYSVAVVRRLPQNLVRKVG